ncbi:MAG TPA: hypothetical protein VIK17_04365 [Cellulomonas sp.]|jgi:hypothetical protein
MVTLLLWTFIALGAAAVVIVVASVASGQEGGVRLFLDDLRAGVSEWRAHGSPSPTVNPEPEPVDATFDEFFASAQVTDDPYLQVDELTDTLAWARGRATRASRSVRLGRR